MFIGSALNPPRCVCVTLTGICEASLAPAIHQKLEVMSAFSLLYHHSLFSNATLTPNSQLRPNVVKVFSFSLELSQFLKMLQNHQTSNKFECLGQLHQQS